MISCLFWNLLQIKVLFVIFHFTIVIRTSFFLSFSERMLILSITENGEESLIFLVMTIFGECIQLKFSPNYIRDSHLGFNAVFSNEILHCSTYVSTGLNLM